MNTTESPFFQGLVRDPARVERAAEFVVERMMSASSDWSSSEFRRWGRWFRGLVQQYASTEASELFDFVRIVAEQSLERELVYPWVVFFADAQRRGVVSRHDARAVMRTIRETGASGYDLQFTCDFVSERGWSFDNCESCGELYLMEDMEASHNDGLVCESCREDHYTWSEYSNRWIHSDSVIEALNESGHRVMIHEDEDGFHYSEEHEMLVHEDYAPRRQRIIRGYHESRPFFSARDDAWSRQFNRLLGVELEVECHTVDPDVAAERIHQHVNGGVFGHRVFFERDGSLSNGFEIITQPMSLPALRELFSFLDAPGVVAGLRSHRTTTCGLHVHVSRSGLDNLTIARAVTFVNDPGNDAFVTALARRYNTGFCRVVEKELDTAHLPGDRYEAINLTGRTTIEFRLFRGSLKLEAVIAAIEFSHALLEFCARAGTGAASLNAQAFLAFCARELELETATMRAYVHERTAGLFRHAEAA